MKWIDVVDIAVALVDAHPDVDPVHVRFIDLMAMVVALPDFDDAEDRCNERILEAIQMAWIDER